MECDTMIELRFPDRDTLNLYLPDVHRPWVFWDWGSPPERVWYPLPELPLVVCETCYGHDIAHDGSPGCGSCHGGADDLAVGDRVTLTTPCPCRFVKPGEATAFCGCRDGWLRPADATITEIRPVVEDDDLNGQDRIIRCRDTEGWLTARKSGPATRLPGDWSVARFGVRLSDVKEP